MNEYKTKVEYNTNEMDKGLYQKKLLELSSIIENAPYILTKIYGKKISGNSKGASNSSSHSSNSSSHSASRATLPLEDRI